MRPTALVCSRCSVYAFDKNPNTSIRKAAQVLDLHLKTMFFNRAENDLCDS